MPRIAKQELPEQFSKLGEERNRLHEKNDCTVIAVSIACSVSYDEAHAALKANGRQNRDGAMLHSIKAAIRMLGYEVREWTFIDRQAVINRYPSPHNRLQHITSHHMRRFPKAWANCHPNLIMGTSTHIWAVKDGKVQDWSVNKSLRVHYVWTVEKRP